MKLYLLKLLLRRDHLVLDVTHQNLRRENDNQQGFEENKRTSPFEVLGEIAERQSRHDGSNCNSKTVELNRHMMSQHYDNGPGYNQSVAL